MNIFVLSDDPREAARMQCNKHVVKMILESAQMLCDVHEPGVPPYSRAHYNHVCSKWARASKQNYEWLLTHADELCLEYKRRYGKIHKSASVIQWCASNIPALPDTGLTPHALAIKPQWRHLIVPGDTVTTYRAYYIADKCLFAKWAPRATPPSWWPFEEKQ